MSTASSKRLSSVIYLGTRQVKKKLSFMSIVKTMTQCATKVSTWTEADNGVDKKVSKSISHLVDWLSNEEINKTLGFFFHEEDDYHCLSVDENI